MKPVKWLLEANVFDEMDSIIQSLKKFGIEYKIYTDSPSDPEGFLKLFDKDDCVLFYGSLGLAQVVRRVAPWMPGVFCNLPQFNCGYYYPRFRSHLLNVTKPYMMIPFGTLSTSRDDILNYCGVDGKVFVRPNTGFKIFTGKVISKETWEKDLKLLSFYDVQPEEMVTVATPREITKEWRLVVGRNRVISGGQYMVNGEFEYSDSCPWQVIDYGNSVLEDIKYRPDPVWCLDVCSVKDGNVDVFKVLEVGAFSTCGLYQAPKDGIIQEVSKIASEEWMDY